MYLPSQTKESLISGYTFTGLDLNAPVMITLYIDFINSEAQATFLLANRWFFLSVSVKNLLAHSSHAKIHEQIKKIWIIIRMFRWRLELHVVREENFT